MQCDICTKKKATVHLTEIVDEQMSEMHLCEECARQKSSQMEQQFGLADLLAGLGDFSKQIKDAEKTNLVCSNCGMSYDDFRKFGRLGCNKCYDAFKSHLSTLLKKLNLTFTANKNTVTGITSDSREVRPGFIYIAISGSLHDGHDFITQAIKQGALWVIGEKTQSTSDCYSVVKDAREALAILACEFYDHPSRSLQVIGVTGTSGKTTTTYILESIFKSAGKKVGVMGTINYRYRDNVYPSSHTTPDAVGLQKFLFEMKKSGCEVVIMEVSSHAIHQKRTFGIAFDAIGFTNLSSEHLDFHKNMEDYLAKLKPNK